MAFCIFCSTELDHATKPEHVLLTAFRGRKSTRRVVCSTCNNEFGRGIDKVLADQFVGIRSLLQLPSGNGSPPPTRRNVKAGSETINIEGNGTIRLQSKPFEIVTLPSGAKNLLINASSFEEIVRLIPNMAAALKMPEEQLREQISKQDGLFVERRPDPIRLDFQFGGPEAMRSVAKSCLVLWTILVGNDEVQKCPYGEIRSFILGKNDVFLGTRTDLDSRPLNLPHGIAEAYGPAFNLIYVKSDRDGRVIGHFTLFNIIAMSVVLALSGGQPDRCIVLISNPVTGEWSDTIADTLDIPFIWLRNPHYDYETMERSRQRFSKIMDYYVSSTRATQNKRIIEDVLKGHGLTKGDQIPKEMAASISSEIAARVASHTFNIPFKKTLEAAKVKEILDTMIAKNTPSKDVLD
jgi:HNH endonuclease